MSTRRIQPENWEDIYAYASALEQFAKTNNPAVFNEFHISHADMAKALRAIALGDDAREVFRQTRSTPGRGSAALFNRTRAYLYWLERTEGKRNQEAIERARNQFTFLPAPNDESILRNARRYQKHAFEILRRDGFDIDRLEGELARHSHKGKWDDSIDAQPTQVAAPPRASAPGIATEAPPTPAPVPADVAPATGTAAPDSPGT